MTIYVADIEAVDNSYTQQWKEHSATALSTNNEVVVISGETSRLNGAFPKL